MEEYNRNTKNTIKIIYFLISLVFLVLYPFWLNFSNYRLVVFFFLVLVFLASNFFLFRKLEYYKEQHEEKPEGGKKRDILLILLISILPQLPLIFMPITTGTDEVHYISTGMYLADAAAKFVGSYGLIFIVALFCFLLLMFRYRNNLMELLTKYFFVFSVLFVLFSIFYFYFISNFFSSYASLYSGKNFAEKAIFLLFAMKSVIFGMPLIAFGFNEWAVRLPCLIAYSVSAVILYKLVIEFGVFKSYSERRVLALYSATILLFSPGFFYLGNLAYDIAIITLASISSLFFILRYQKSHDFKHIFFSFIMIALGVMFDKKAIILWMAIIMFVIVEHFAIRKEGIKKLDKNYIYMLILSFIISAPYFALSSLSFANQLQTAHSESIFNLKNLLDISQLPRYALVTPLVMGILGTVFLGFGAVYTLYLAIKKEKMNIYFVLFYLAVYLFLTSLFFIGIPRYMTIASFIFAVVIAQIIVAIELKTKLFKILGIIFCVALALSTLYHAYYNVQDRYLPMNELFSYIKNNLPNERFMKTMAPSPYNFYILKYDLDFNNFDPVVWENSKNQTVENLYEYMKKKNINYAFFPMPTPSYVEFFYEPDPSTWLDLWQMQDFKIVPVVNHEVVEEMYNNRTELFTKVAEFRHGKNIIFVAKAKL